MNGLMFWFFQETRTLLKQYHVYYAIVSQW